jgi:hypothetical protein
MDDDGDEMSDGRPVLGELQRGRVVISHQPSFPLYHLYWVIIQISVMEMTSNTRFNRSRCRAHVPWQ